MAKYIVERVAPKLWIIEDDKANCYGHISDIGYMFKIITEDNVKATFATIEACMNWFTPEGEDWTIAIGEY